MEYQKRSKNGDGGEYFVAYSVTQLLGWPCRLYAVDIGVDGETEVLDNAGRSTGDVIKLQIKTFDRITAEVAANVYTDEKHISHWKKFCLPVIICCVDLAAEKIYWRQITTTEAFASGGVSMRVGLTLRITCTELAHLAQILGLAAPSQRFGIDEDDVVLIGFRCVYHKGGQANASAQHLFQNRANSTQAQKPAPPHDPAAQAASFNNSLKPTPLRGAA
jgi:Domain of unknown function (DUF4365)